MHVKHATCLGTVQVCLVPRAHKGCLPEWGTFQSSIPLVSRSSKTHPESVDSQLSPRPAAPYKEVLLNAAEGGSMLLLRTSTSSLLVVGRE